MEHMDDIIRSREIIKRKYNALRRGEEETSNALEKTFKPIADPLKAILRMKDSPMQTSLLPIKKEEEMEPPVKKEKIEDPEIEDLPGHSKEETSDQKAEEEDTTDTDSASDMEEGSDWEDAREDDPEDNKGLDDTKLLDSYVGSNFGPISSSYFRDMISNVDSFDHVNGVRVGQNGEWMLGDKSIRFDKDDNMLIGDQTFAPSKGLFDLIFKRSPQEYSTDDLERYKKVLDLTNAHRRSYVASNPVRGTRAKKYKDIIKKLYPKTTNLQTGSGIFVPLESKRTYVYWDDPNELVERLLLLVASRNAGNTSVEREILSIEEELREAGYIR